MDTLKRTRISSRMPAPRKPPLAIRRRFGDCCARLIEALRLEKAAGLDELATCISDIPLGSGSMRDTVKVCNRIDAALAKFGVHTEPPRDSERLHYFSRMEKWEDQVDIRKKCVSVRCGWSASTNRSIGRAGQQSAR